MLSRRDWLIRSANGFGAVALASMLAEGALPDTRILDAPLTLSFNFVIFSSPEKSLAPDSSTVSSSPRIAATTLHSG